MRTKEAIDILHKENCSCVIATTNGRMLRYNGRGVSDLYRLLTEEPQTLNGAFVADKVIGKGGAALLVLGGVSGLYTDLISESALRLLREADILVGYGECVPTIINRSGTGPCPVEKLCAPCRTAEECLPLIADFLLSINSNTNSTSQTSNS